MPHLCLGPFRKADLLLVEVALWLCSLIAFLPIPILRLAPYLLFLGGLAWALATPHPLDLLLTREAFRCELGCLPKEMSLSASLPEGLSISAHGSRR